MFFSPCCPCFARGTVSTLDLSWNDIGGYEESEAAINALGDALVWTSTLTELSIAGNDIRDDEIANLANCIHGSGLLTLNIASNDFSSEQEMELHRICDEKPAICML